VRLLAAVVVVVCVLSVGAANAAAADAPYLEHIASVLRQRSPGTEGNVWWLSDGNELPTPTASSPGWLLQTLNCWGQNPCSKPPPGGQAVLRKIEEMVSIARKSVDIADLAQALPGNAGPDGAYYQAIRRGLEQGHKDHPREVPLVRLLVGAFPGSNDNLKLEYIDLLPQIVGGWVKIQTGVYRTTPFSWNHAKVLDVDGREAIVGGMNYWSGDYLQSTHPVNDLSMWVKGPAAADVSRFMNVLWNWTCDPLHRFNPVFLDIVKTYNTGGFLDTKCFDDAPTSRAPAASNGVSIMVVGKLGDKLLGTGIDVPGHANGESTAFTRPKLSGNTCNNDQAKQDNKDVNTSRKYEYRNPGETALRALIGEAKRSIFISQQDLLSCLPTPWAASEAKFDERVFAALADKVVQGVPIKIVLSSKGGGYSNGWEPSDVAQVLMQMLQKNNGLPQAVAKQKLCSDVGLTTVRNDANSTTWKDGTPFYNHAKLVAVDDQAFYIGSGNLYPSALQELGMIVDDSKAGAELKKYYLDPLWQNSRTGALIDPETNTCKAFPLGAPNLLTVKRRSRTFILRAHTTKTFNVGYTSTFTTPSTARRYCQAQVSGPGARNVKVLTRVSVRGGLGGPPLALLPVGNVCRVSVRNNANRRGPRTVARIKVTATTAY
jgi:phosphatidylserine/phosphatidylglycerophosphate/cardiolipin synthase-like enzyme